MTAPHPLAVRTLLDLMGATPPRPHLGDSVLLIIDAQREYVDGALPLVGIDEALTAGGNVLARARAAGAPVVHILHRADGPLFNPQGHGYQPAPPLLPRDGETVIEKTKANAFAGTALHEALIATGRKSLIVIGFMTHNCVSSTVRAANEKGFTCTVVAPATATRDLPDGDGGTLPAAAVQAACLVGLSDTLARIAWTTDDLIG
ncbi:cysteine hydrolase family protein [Rhodocyclus gracilis]|uniref:Isochorismatase family protein n=1 Tax=Rhodocyclus tenuis TaxID=1066 RepID=A0A6L5JUH1_RHOTE|nr:cysteine hydrolase family protein [Rhodocyclus gracilis]MQY50190.1 isochorismatase family protein [Rhodocyclus gracilis]